MASYECTTYIDDVVDSLPATFHVYLFITMTLTSRGRHWAGTDDKMVSACCLFCSNVSVRQWRKHVASPAVSTNNHTSFQWSNSRQPGSAGCLLKFQPLDIWKKNSALTLSVGHQ